MMEISKSFDTIYNDLLTAHFNKGGVDAPLLLRIVYWSVALLGYGIYRLINFVSRQIFPDTSSAPWLDRHARIRGLTRSTDESDASLLQRVIDDIQYPPAGGCLKDWERWAKECSFDHPSGGSPAWTETVISAAAIENARGNGTINIVILSDRSETGYEKIATDDLIEYVTDYLDARRPLGIWDFQVFPCTKLATNVTMEIVADDFSATASNVGASLIEFMDSLAPGAPLVVSQIQSIAIECGATDVAVSAPGANVYPDNGPGAYERIVSGTISISDMS